MKLNLEHIFGFVIIALMLVIFVLMLKAGCKRNPEIDHLQEANNTLVKEGLKKDSIIMASEVRVSDFEHQSATLKIENQKLKARISLLEANRRAINSEVEQLSADTIYARLQEILPTTGNLRSYKFSSNQIKAIYITDIKYHNLLSSDSNYVILVQNLEKQLTFKDSVITEKDLQITTYKEKIDLKEGIIINKDDMIKYLEAEVKHQRRNKVLWQIGTIGVGIVAIATLL